MSEKETARRIIAGNWKMHKTREESQAFIRELEKKLGASLTGEVVVFPPFTALPGLRGMSKKIKIGAQNLHQEEKGAFTGEISALMLESLVEYVLVGHSERRHVFGESDETINNKLLTALTHGFRAVCCVGETLDQREKGDTMSVIDQQLAVGLRDITTHLFANLVIAYEPVWAIGTGKTAGPEQAQEVHRHIRTSLQKILPQASAVPILYGGSVKPDNTADLLQQEDIDGVLVGGASLKVDSFFDIINTSQKLGIA